MPSTDVRLLKGYGMIGSHILKLDRFSHLSARSFGFGFSIGFKALSLALSLRVGFNVEPMISIQT